MNFSKFNHATKKYIFNSSITKGRFYRIVFMVWLGMVILSYFTGIGSAVNVIASDTIQYSSSGTPITTTEALNGSINVTWSLEALCDDDCEYWLSQNNPNANIVHGQTYINGAPVGTADVQIENISVGIANESIISIHLWCNPCYPYPEYFTNNITVGYDYGAVDYNNTNTILFSSSSDWQNSAITSRPIDQAFYINTWINDSNWDPDHDYYSLWMYYPNGEYDELNDITIDNQVNQVWLQLSSHKDYGSYTFKIHSYYWDTFYATSSIYIYNASDPDQPSNPDCVEDCTPPTDDDDWWCWDCFNPWFEKAKMHFSTDISGLNIITSAHNNDTVYLHFNHQNGDYASYNYNISFIQPDETIFFNLPVDYYENGYATWAIPASPSGEWQFDFKRINKANATDTTILKSIGLNIEASTPPAPTNLSNLSGYVKQAGNLTPIYGATINAVKGYTLTATTNTYGYYIIPNMLDGNYTVTASKTGYNSSSVNITINNGSINNQNFILGCAGACPTPAPTTPGPTETPVGPTPTAPPPPSDNELGVLFWDNLFIWSFVIGIMVVISFFDKK